MLLMLVLSSACSLLPSQEDPLDPPLVVPQEETFPTTEARRGTIETFIRGVGNFASGKSAPLAFEASGARIASIDVKLGEAVTTGQTLVTLDTGDLETRITLQRINLERAQLMLRQAVTSGSEGIELRLRELDLERETVTMQSLEEQLRSAKLTAPFDGVVTYMSKAEPGSLVTAYEPIITIADPTEYHVAYRPNSSTPELFDVQPGMAATVSFDGIDYPGKVVQTPASARESNPALADELANVIIIEPLEPIDGVMIGNSAAIAVPLKKRDNAVIIPRNGLRDYLGRKFVQVAEGERLFEVDVEIGLQTPTEVEIVQGLEAGAQVVLMR